MTVALCARRLGVDGRLAEVDASFPQGSLTAVVGPNGAGKSTLLQALAGLLPATGEVEWGGWPLRRIASPVLQQGPLPQAL